MFDYTLIDKKRVEERRCLDDEASSPNSYIVGLAAGNNNACIAIEFHSSIIYE